LTTKPALPEQGEIAMPVRLIALQPIQSSDWVGGTSDITRDNTINERIVGSPRDPFLK
jgi:hypothetical protein